MKWWESDWIHNLGKRQVHYMRVEDCKIAKWAQELGTPLYLYDEEVLHDRYHQLRMSLHPSVDIGLSLKANNNISLAARLRRWGSCVEVASMGELHLARLAGFPPERIIFSGPGKTAEELENALEYGIYCINAESFDEVDRIAALAAERKFTAGIGIRINPNMSIVNTAIRMGGLPRQFGIDESSLTAMVKKLKCMPNISFKGIHIYSGTQILDSNQIIKAFNYTINLAKELQIEHGLNFEFIDLGGGFGVPYFSHEKELDIEHVCRETNKLVAEYLQHSPKTRFMIETGRFLLAESGAYVARVLYVKESKGEKFLILDGGMHHHVSSTFRGRTMRNNFPVRLVRSNGTPAQGNLERVNLVGPLCTPEDCLAKDIELPEANAGDYIMLLKSGAYGLSYSPLQFLGHPTPLEALVANGKLSVIRERGDVSDLLRHQYLPKDI
ncbi:diaminopimelate decarboxylase [Paenibacillus sp. FSL H8-0259]|uniref:diaminopimelate decarboxylase n=2 Tax=Paenibacillus sp. FSL H8-0259 TaxID=1920423 RepID=UPI002116C988|nr:diaminopimelate decarboxylase [Paenibacillus sp. FSL H8-0259]